MFEFWKFDIFNFLLALKRSLLTLSIWKEFRDIGSFFWTNGNTYFSSKALYFKLLFDYLKRVLMEHCFFHWMVRLSTFLVMVAEESLLSSLMPSTRVSLSEDRQHSSGWRKWLRKNSSLLTIWRKFLKQNLKK